MPPKSQKPTVEELTKEQVEFLNKIPLGTIARVKKAELKRDLTRLKNAKGKAETAVSKVSARAYPDCRSLGGCCNWCNCIFYGGGGVTK